MTNIILQNHPWDINSNSTNQGSLYCNRYLSCFHPEIASSSSHLHNLLFTGTCTQDKVPWN